MNEEEIIRFVAKKLGRRTKSQLPFGDDVAAYYLNSIRKWLVAKVDMLVASTDVPPGMNMAQAVRKAMAMSVSDFAAKGVKPEFGLLSMGLPRKMATITHLRQLAKGIKLAMKEFDLKIIGGDTNEAEELIFDVCLVGLSDKIVTRNTAKAGDLVVVTGTFGYTSAGLLLLLKGLKPRSQEEGEAITKVLLPTPPLKLALAIARAGLVTSSIDSSDGLALSLYYLAEASKKRIEVTQLPYDERVLKLASRLRKPVDELVLYGGEELEIIYTLPRKNLQKARALAQRFGRSLKVIGRVVEGEGVTYRGEKLERRGWVHLSAHRLP
jgi:thiamine-monophosphate kinase